MLEQRLENRHDVPVMLRLMVEITHHFKGVVSVEQRMIKLVTEGLEASVAGCFAALYASGQKTPLKVYEVPGKRFRIHAGDTRYWSFVEIDKKRDWPWGKPEDKGRPRVECLVETFDPKIDRDMTYPLLVSRGVSWWDGGAKERIFFGTLDGRLFSLDPKTGKPDPTFGKQGFVDLPPTIQTLGSANQGLDAFGTGRAGQGPGQ